MELIRNYGIISMFRAINHCNEETRQFKTSEDSYVSVINYGGLKEICLVNYECAEDNRYDYLIRLHSDEYKQFMKKFILSVNNNTDKTIVENFISTWDEQFSL